MKSPALAALLATVALMLGACEEAREQAIVTVAAAASQWPDEAGPFVPLSDQPWDGIVQPDRASRLLARARALIFSEPDGHDEWQYLRRSSSRDDDIVVDGTAPFSPPHVLRIVFTPDMQKDHEPSVHWIALPSARTVYATWWIKLSPNWTSSPAGGGKMTFLHFANGHGQAYTGLFGSTEPHRVSVNTEWAPYGQKIWDPNRETTPILYDRWYRIEWYVKWESSPGAGDATIAWRVNGTLNGEYTNVQLPEGAAAFQQFEFAPTLQNPPRAEQYMYIDHTSITVK